MSSGGTKYPILVYFKVRCLVLSLTQPGGIRGALLFHQMGALVARVSRPGVLQGSSRSFAFWWVSG